MVVAPLIVAPASTRYADLHVLDMQLGLPGSGRIGKRLWRVPEAMQPTPGSLCCHSAGTELLLPLARAPSYKRLVSHLAASGATGSQTPWALRFEDHAQAAQADGGPRASDYLCGVARYLEGPPAVFAEHDAAARTSLVLLRCTPE
eukprot:6565459-Prymnesium_polylepis.1